ncbi:hypothetical protein SGRIM128S_09726 [Streptomyces griseomycini]
MPSRPRLRSLVGLRRRRSGRPARAAALTSGSVLLALGATLLPPPALTPFVRSASAAPWSEADPPEQRTGTAAGREHAVGFGRTDANGRGTADPADLTAARGALPLHDPGTAFAPVEPKTAASAPKPRTEAGDQRDPAGYDPGRSVEETGERTAASKEFRNPDGTRTTRVYTEQVHYRGTDGTWREIDTSLVPADGTEGAPRTGQTGGDRLAAAADDTGLTLATRGDDPALATLEVDDGRHEVGFGLSGAAGAAAEVREDAAHYEDVRRDSDIVLEAAHGAVKETIVLNSPDAPREWTFPLHLDGLTPSLDAHGAVLLKDAEGEVQAVISKGWMEDSAHDPRTGGPALSGDVDYRLVESDGRWSLKVVLDEAWLAGTYRDVQLGAPGAARGAAPDTAATFNGTTSYVQLPDQLVSDTPYLTAELWFRTTGSGVLLQLQDHTLEEATTGKYTPALYVGTDGKLRGEFWNGADAPITSAAAVDDGAWHHAALTAAGNTQTLYLDGKRAGSLSGEITQYDQRFVYLGAGYWNNWPATTGTVGHFAGDIDEAAVYSRPLGARTVAEHHASAQVAQQLTKVTRSSGRVHAEVAYDTVHDRVSSYTDANGGTYRLSSPRATGTEDQPATDDQQAVDGAPALTVTVTDPDDRTSGYTYDPLQGNRLTAQTDTAGHTARFAYDTGGYLAATTGPDGSVTRFGNDERGNRISQTTCRETGDESTCHTSYSSYFHNPDDPLDPRNDQLTAVRDARSASATDDTHKTSHGYNTFGDRTSTTTPAGTESFTFTDGTEPATGGGTTPAGLLATSTDARGAVTRRAYTAAGDLAKVTDPRGVVTEYTYDALGRETGSTVISDAHPDGVTTTTTYDGESRPLTVTGPVTTNEVTGTDHRARTTYTYDGDGRVLTESVADLLGGDATRTTKRAYDTHGHLASLTDPEGGEETYAYDAYGRQTSRTLPGDRTFRYTYTALGSLATVTLTGYTGDPNDPSAARDVVLDSYAYDPAGRLAEHTDAMGRTTRHTYHDDGLKAREILVGFHDPDGSTRDLVLSDRTSDAAGHLVRETTGNGKVTTAYEVDAAGRTAAEVLDPSGLARRTAYTYDAGGAVHTATRTGTGGTRTEKVTYERNTSGDLVRQTVENGTTDLVTTHEVDDRGLVLATTSPRGNTTGSDPAAYTTHHTYDALGRLVATRDAPVSEPGSPRRRTSARPPPSATTPSARRPTSATPTATSPTPRTTARAARQPPRCRPTPRPAPRTRCPASSPVPTTRQATWRARPTPWAGPRPTPTTSSATCRRRRFRLPGTAPPPRCRRSPTTCWASSCPPPVRPGPAPRPRTTTSAAR